MYQLDVDVARNRLSLRGSGRNSKEDLERLAAEMAAAVRRLRPGFVASVDLRGLQILDQETAHGVTEIQRAMTAGQPSKVATLLDSAMVKLQVNTARTGTGIERVSRQFTNEAEWREFAGM